MFSLWNTPIPMLVIRRALALSPRTGGICHIVDIAAPELAEAAHFRIDDADICFT